jgi:hypothetical protein
MSCCHDFDSEYGHEVVGGGSVVGPVQTRGASSIPTNLEEVEADTKMATGLHFPAMGIFSFIVHRYKDDRGYLVF